jgi:LysM repeat protein
MRIRKSWLGKEWIFIFVAVCLLMILSFGLFLIYMDRSNYSGKIAFIEQRINALEQRISSYDKQAILNSEAVGNLSEKLESFEKRLLPKEKAPEPPKLASPSDKKVYHEVQKGETLFQIAQKYKISVDDLRRANNLSPNAAIVRGQKLLIVAGDKR